MHRKGFNKPVDIGTGSGNTRGDKPSSRASDEIRRRANGQGNLSTPAANERITSPRQDGSQNWTGEEFARAFVDFLLCRHGVRKQTQEDSGTATQTGEEYNNQEKSIADKLGTDFDTLENNYKVDRLRKLLTSGQSGWYSEWRIDTERRITEKNPLADNIRGYFLIADELVTEEYKMLNNIRSIMEDQSNDQENINEKIRDILKIEK